MKNELFWIAIAAWLAIATLYCLLLCYSHKVKTLSIDLELTKAECEFYKHRLILSENLYKNINEHYKQLDKMLKTQEYKKYETMHTRSLGVLSQSESNVRKD